MNETHKTPIVIKSQVDLNDPKAASDLIDDLREYLPGWFATARISVAPIQFVIKHGDGYLEFDIFDNEKQQ